jgi:hypothetical protein
MGWYLITILAENKPGVVPIESMHDLLHDQIIEGKRRAKVAEIVAEAQKLIRVEILEAPETPLAPAEPLTPPVPAPAVPEVPEGTAPVTPDSTPALPAPS